MHNGSIAKVAVIGAGTMGPGIAQSFARHGLEVSLYTRRQETLDRALRVIEASLDVFIEEGLLGAGEKEVILARIRPTRFLEEVGAGADLVVETVVEKKEVKQEVFRELDGICPRHTIFTSNTSYLDIFSITPRPSLTAIAHWFAPPQVVPLVEVVKGPQTSEATVEAVTSLLTAIGKVPVVLNKFVPGFVINRLQRALGREIFYLLDNGFIDAEALDLAVKASLAPRMMVVGVVQRYDFTGLDLSARNLENPEFSEAPENNRPSSLFGLVEAGCLGVKTGKGFYDYSGRKTEEILKERDRRLLRVFAGTGFCLEKL
ncbi:3-hydroxyacyl-CoA dehydrogenase family protein [Moorella sulfitireducens]|uniref:3-hydroxyacyl-CoA dehydrogenase family protein n=1 Tax=Neomoorella sulfitireducens TaxID=2972948 RepID=UPI0021AC41EB|nr:3-hydroxyacyl-CoA dehydrogenase family protein [Moorella sulfitireducens]